MPTMGVPPDIYGALSDEAVNVNTFEIAAECIKMFDTVRYDTVD